MTLPYIPLAKLNDKLQFEKEGTIMARSRTAYQGCLLGLAAGDAMGGPVDAGKWREIREDYGPNGLLGYDLVNGYAEVTAHTQLCAFTCNGLLLGLTRSQLQGRAAPFVRYIALSHKEWASAQRRHSTLQRTYCWVYWVDELRRRRCADGRMLDTLAEDRIGSPEEPVNNLDGPGSLAAAVAVGLFARAHRLDPDWRDRLGAEAVALTCGHPSAYVSGAVIAHLVGAVLEEPEKPLEHQITEALDAAQRLFGAAAHQVKLALGYAISLARQGGSRQAVMESLVCGNAVQVLAAAVYTLLTCGDDFDAAMVTAVNHSGRSCAVAALVGAVLGARMGVEGLPEFYLDGLEIGGVLRELAEDLATGCPRPMTLEWDRKYLQGER